MRRFVVFSSSLLTALVWLAVTVASAWSQGLVEAQDWSTLARIVEPGPDGVDCLVAPEAGTGPLARLHYKQVVRSNWTKNDNYTLIQTGSLECWVASSSVAAVHKSPVYCLERPGGVAPLPLTSVVDKIPQPDSGVRVGPLYPTFYQVAYEGYYPLEKGAAKVSVVNEAGRPIAEVSEQFHKALLMQGTGSLMDGRVLNVGQVVDGRRRFVVLPRGHLGLGIEGFALVAYRSMAVDFDWLCDAIGGQGCTAGNAQKKEASISRANRKALAGTLVFVPRLAGIDVFGVRHDGYVCAVDVGGGIRGDRVDLFVGTDGAGNPYLPECRRTNPWIEQGVESLVPWDWHYWESSGGKSVRTRPLEYRDNARQKGLDAVAFPGIRCHKQPR